MSFFEGFTTFNFNEGVPYVSVTKNGVSFNKGVIMKLGCPTHVTLLMNMATKQIAIKVCDASDPNAQPFFNADKKSNTYSARWNGRDLMLTIKDMTGWDYEKESYRIEGTMISSENAMLFDFNKAEPIT